MNERDKWKTFDKCASDCRNFSHRGGGAAETTTAIQSHLAGTKLTLKLTPCKLIKITIKRALEGESQDSFASRSGRPGWLAGWRASLEESRFE